jgi:hypothetical protein
MTTDHRDDAFSWAGDDDPTLDPLAHEAQYDPPVTTTAQPRRGGAVEPAGSRPGSAESRTSRPAEIPTVRDQAELAEDAAVEAELAAAEKATAQLSSVALISYGVLGGIYLLYTIGWLIHVLRQTLPVFPISSAFGEILFQVQQLLGVVAAPLWLIAALLLTKGRTTRSRIGWLLLGVFVLVPWPFIWGQ